MPTLRGPSPWQAPGPRHAGPGRLPHIRNTQRAAGGRKRRPPRGVQRPGSRPHPHDAGSAQQDAPETSARPGARTHVPAATRPPRKRPFRPRRGPEEGEHKGRPVDRYGHSRGLRRRPERRDTGNTRRVPVIPPGSLSRIRMGQRAAGSDCPPERSRTEPPHPSLSRRSGPKPGAAQTDPRPVWDIHRGGHEEPLAAGPHARPLPHPQPPAPSPGGCPAPGRRSARYRKSALKAPWGVSIITSNQNG